MSNVALPSPRFSPHNPYWREAIEGMPDEFQPRNNAHNYLYAWTWELRFRKDVGGALSILIPMMRSDLYHALQLKSFRYWLRSNWRTISSTSSTQGESVK